MAILQGDLFVMQDSIDSNSLRIDGAYLLIGENRQEIKTNREGIAIAMSMQDAHLLPGQTTAITGGVAAFDGEYGISFSGAKRLNENVVITAGFGSGFSQDAYAGRAGFSYGW